MYQQKETDMKTYLETLLQEKGISLDTVLEAEGKQEFGTNYIPMSAIVEFMDSQYLETKQGMKAKLVQIDFNNGDVMHFFQHIANFLAI